MTKSVTERAIVTVLLSALSPAVAGGVGICLVEDTAGQQNMIVRKGERIPSVAYTPVYQGDVILIGSQNGVVTIRCGGTIERITLEQSPFTLETETVQSTKLSNLLEWLSSFFHDLPKESEIRTVSLRGVPLAIPLLESLGSSVSAEREVLHVGWIGGRLPVTIKLRLTLDGAVVFSGDVTESARAVLPLRQPMSPGTYELELLDANSELIRIRFEAVKPENLPVVHRADFALLGERRVQQTLHAALLVRANGGRFAFEAYQMVSEIAHEHLPASRLSRALERGLRPPPLLLAE